MKRYELIYYVFDETLHHQETYSFLASNEEDAVEEAKFHIADLDELRFDCEETPILIEEDASKPFAGRYIQFDVEL